MSSNKYLDLRKIVNFVRSKEKTANFGKPCKSFKIVDEILTCKGKRWVIFDNDRKILNHSILPLIQYSFTTFDCKESKPFKCFNIKISYSFLFTRKFREYLFSKGALICWEKATPRSIYFPGNYDWRVAHTYGIFKQKVPSCKKKELHVNSTSNTFHKKYENLN